MGNANMISDDEDQPFVDTPHRGVSEYTDDPDDDTEEVVNISGNLVKFQIDGTRYKLAPGARMRIHKNYVRQQKMAANRDPVASAIEMLTGGAVVSSSNKNAPRAG